MSSYFAAPLYESLVWDDEVRSADLIFVMAGRIERKQYGIELYRAGIAPRLILSIGRFEVGKLSRLDLEGLDQLISLRDKTPPRERHFFLKVGPSGCSVEKVRLWQWNTYGEALALRELADEELPRRVIVVSTDVHLRRVRLACMKAFRDADCELLYCAVPSHLSPVTKHSWWRHRNERRFVLKEWAKLLGYRAILSLPDSAARQLMRLSR